MKVFRRCFYALASLAVMTACSDDKLELGDMTPGHSSYPGEASGEGVYMSLEIKMPNGGSRSSTDGATGENGDNSNSDANPDTEVGSDAENAVNSVAIVLAETDNTFITFGLVRTDRISSIPSKNSYETLAKFSKSDFYNYYEEKGEGEKNINVFVFCNPTSDLLDKLTVASIQPIKDSKWIDETCTVTAGISGTPDVNTSIWSDNNFLMSNYSIAERQLPKKYDDWDNYRTEKTAFDLSGMNNEGDKDLEIDNKTAIAVERAVARFDYKDGSEKGDRMYGVLNSIKTEDNGDGTTSTVAGDPFVYVDLGRMCLVNMSNQFYYLPRVSSTGENTGSDLCGKETNSNYVVGPYWEQFVKASSTTAGLDTNAKAFLYDGVKNKFFNYPFFNSDCQLDTDNYNRWFTSNADDVLSGATTDKWNGKNDYKVWRYVTENVIPGAANQKNGISTGIVFKAKISVDMDALNGENVSYPNADVLNQYLGENADIKGDGTDPFLFYFSGILYAGWLEVRQAVYNECVTLQYTTDQEKPNVIINDNTPLYRAVYGSGGMGTIKITYKYYDEDGVLHEDGEFDYPDPKKYSDTCPDAIWAKWFEQPETDRYKEDNALLAQMREAVTGRGSNTTGTGGGSETVIPNFSEEGFTIFQSGTDPKMGKGYFCYYYYWNRHNDNNRPGDMGPMEFATVRNNVYKLSVSAINRLGHPTISANDPNPPTPDTDDEVDDIYIKVLCDVLPWTVRVNDIVFN